MEVLARKLQLPEIPEELIKPAAHLLTDTAFQERHVDPTGTCGFVSLYDAGLKDLEEYLKTNIMPALWCISFFMKDAPAHKDPRTRTRLIYTLNPGGENVRTNFYEEDKVTLLDSVRLSSNTWSLLNASRFHEVKNIESGNVRYAITTRVHSYPQLGDLTESFISKEFSIKAIYPPLLDSILDRLKLVSQDITTDDLGYRKQTLESLGLGNIVKWLNLNIQEGIWYLEKISNPLRLIPTHHTAELSIALEHIPGASIHYTENKTTIKHINDYEVKTDEWRINVISCYREFTNPQINLTCSLLGSD